MIHNRDLQTYVFEKIISGQRTFITSFDESISAKIGDYIACNEWEHGYTGRCCLVKVSDISEMEDAAIYAVNPCRIDEHVRLTAAVYGEKEGGSDDT